MVLFWRTSIFAAFRVALPEHTNEIDTSRLSALAMQFVDSTRTMLAAAADERLAYVESMPALAALKRNCIDALVTKCEMSCNVSHLCRLWLRIHSLRRTTKRRVEHC